MYRYHDPKTVKIPKDKVKSVEVIFDGGENPGYSVAIVDWEGTKGIGMRWNINNREWEDSEKQNGNKICIGEPNSRGYATWFMLPKDFLKRLTILEDDEFKKVIEKAIKQLDSVDK